MKKLIVLFIACAALLRSCFDFPVTPGPGPEPETEEETFYVPEAKVDVPLYDGTPRYAYGTLEEEQKALYEKIRGGAADLQPYVQIDDALEASYVYQAVFFDHPELFFITEKPKIKEGKLYYEYVFTSDQIKSTFEGLDEAYNGFVTENITGGMTEFEKFLTVYTYLVNITKYAEDAYELYEENKFTYGVYRSMSAAGPLCDRRSICTGYARATQYLCQRLGIECFTVNGYGNEGNHYFNIVKLGGNWYYSDTTWGDPVGSDRSIDYLTYYYFCTTTEELLRTHSIYSVIPMPECTATEYNYFRYFDLYAETLEQAESILCREYEKGLRDITIKVPYGDTGEAIYDALHNGSLYNAMYERGLDPSDYRISYGKQTQAIIIRF